MDTIKWIFLTLLLSALLAGPTWGPLITPMQQPDQPQGGDPPPYGGDDECCLAGLSCCERPGGGG